MTVDDVAGETERQLEYYRRQLDALAGDNLALDSALAGARHAIQRSRRAFALLSELQLSIAGLEQLPAVYDRIVTEANTALGMDRTIVLTPFRDPAFFRPAHWAVDRPELGPAVADAVIDLPPSVARGGEFLLVTRATAVTPAITAIRDRLQLRYFVCLPIVLERATIAVILTGRSREARPFYPPLDEGDVDAVRAIATLVAGWIRSRRLAQLETRLEAEAARTRVAAAIQLDLLPKTAPAIPGYDIAGRTIPAQVVGGDYFDFIPLDEKRYAICLADVSGKGLTAALLMANLQATIRGQTAWNPSACDCLTHANRLFHRSTDPSKFATVFYAVLNARSHWLAYSSAGHNPALLVTPEGRIEWLGAGGTVLGAFDNSAYDEDAVVLSRGGLLVVYSDGITEALNGDDEEFGLDRLQSCVFEHRHLAAAALIDALVDAVQQHAAGAQQSDDMTLVVVKR